MRKYKYQDKPKILRDVSRMLFALPEVLLKMINMWPMNQNWFRRMLFFVQITLVIVIETGQLVYLTSIADLAKMTATMSTFSTTLQAIVKISVMFSYSKRLKPVIQVAYNEFWPANFLGDEVEKDLKGITTLMYVSMYSLLASALVFAFGFLTKPLIDGSMLLPFDSWYPFNWQVSPVYEIIYVTQVFCNIYIIIVSILGHDFFFLALCCNVIGQYKLLKNVISKVGSGEDAQLNETLGKFVGVDATKRSGEDSEERSLLIKCIQHHYKLIMVSDEMRTVFATSFFVQLMASVAAICVSSYNITMIEIDMTQLYHLTSYCLGHVLQLFMICAAGNELSYQSQSFGDYAFKSDWHKKKYLDIRRSLVMIIRRCQRGSKLTALGIIDLNYNTFVAVMRLSFSFYTLLSNMTEKKNQLELQ